MEEGTLVWTSGNRSPLSLSLSLSLSDKSFLLILGKTLLARGKVCPHPIPQLLLFLLL